jgi:hypothetical protein
MAAVPRETIGLVQPDSLAAESLVKSGAFRANENVTINSATTTRPSDTTTAEPKTVIQPASSASARDVEYPAPVPTGRSGPKYSEAPLTPPLPGKSEDHGQVGKNRDRAHVHADAAPTYVLNVINPPTGHPKGAGLKEEQFEGEPANTVRISDTPGGEMDPGRKAVEQIVRGRKEAPGPVVRDGWTGGFDALKSEEPE